MESLKGKLTMESLKGKLTEEEYACITCLNCNNECLYCLYSRQGYNERKLLCPYVSSSILKAKNVKIIKQNPVEKAEEILKRLHGANIDTKDFDDILFCIQYLQKQLEEK